MCELLEAHAEDPLAHLEEAFVPREIVRRETHDFLAHPVGVARVVDGMSLVEPDPVEGSDWPEIDVVRELLPRERPELFEQRGRRNNGGPRVERESALFVDICSSTGRIELLEHRDAVSTCAQPNRGSEPTESAADDDCVRALLHHAIVALYKVCAMLTKRLSHFDGRWV